MTETKPRTEMDIAARHAVAQGWCEPEVADQEMDPVLAEAISKPVARALTAWCDTAAQHLGNEQYYRGLLVQIGEAIGDAAYICDDGSRSQDVLCAKLPALVRNLTEEAN